MNSWKRVLALCAALGLAACGGGGSSSGTPGVGSPSTSGVADLVIVLSAGEIPNSSTSTVTATVTAVDANRRGVEGVAVNVAVDSNAVVATGSATTDASGRMTATIGIGADRTNRTITFTAQVGSLSRTAALRVVTDSSVNPTAADLTLTLSAPSVPNGGTSTVVATVTAVDRNRNVVGNVPVAFSVDSAGTVAPAGPVTNAQGIATATIGIGADRTNRVMTVTATSGDLVRTASFAVVGAKLTVATSPLVVAGSVGNVVEFTLVDFNALPMVDHAIAVTGAGLPSVSGRTDLNGKFRYTYTAPSVPGALEIVATAAGDQRTQQVTVSAAASAVAPAPELPQSASITPTPSVVAVNAPGSNANQVELRALFIGANNRPIPRMRARFDLAGNLGSTDGTISWVGSYAYSDENGIARATFTPGQRSSPTNGVTVRVCYDTVDFGSGPGGACDQVPRSATQTLTVSLEALAVSIATNNEIKQGVNDLTYIKEYVVLVTDSAGVAKADVQITPSVDLTGYRKGFYFWTGQLWAQRPTLADTERYVWTGTAWASDPASAPISTCPNEDVNRNGAREAASYVTGAAAPPLGARQEDLNWNGDLDPRKSFVAVKMVGSSKTDANGLAIVQLEYGESVATWIDFVLTVTASGVSGTEARARHIGTLPASGADVTQEAVPPAFHPSPFGTGTVCTDTH